jgi:hypothetical protein
MADPQASFRPDQVPNMAAVLQAPTPMDAITRHHYENLATGKEYRHTDGSGKVSTVFTIQVDIDGIPTLIPTVWDGEIIENEREATRRAIASGIKWPTRATHAKLREFDQKIHRAMKDISPEEAQDILDKSK